MPSRASFAPVPRVPRPVCWRAAIAALCALALACAVSSRPASPLGSGDDGSSGEAPPHPLVDRIWDVQTGAFIDEPALLQQLEERRFVLLGEVHDNPAQHLIQAELVRALGRRGRRPAVVFEMIPRDRGTALADVLSEPTPRPEDVRRAVGWDASGWPDFAMYAPIFAAALEAGLPVLAGDLTHADREALRRDGIAGLGAARIAALGLDAPLDAAAEATLVATIREGHCNLLPDSAVPRLVEFQRARDAELADALREAAGSEGALLIAGAGHARRDVAVPAFLARSAPEAGVVSLALVEVEDGAIDPARLLAERFGSRAPFDYVWFTVRTPRADPCEAMRRHLAQPRSR